MTFSLEGWLSDKKLVTEHSKGPEVYFFVVKLPGHHFRRLDKKASKDFCLKTSIQKWDRYLTK